MVIICRSKFHTMLQVRIRTYVAQNERKVLGALSQLMLLQKGELVVINS